MMKLAKVSFVLAFLGAASACSSAPGDESASTPEAYGVIGNFCFDNTSAITPEVWDGHTKLWAWGPSNSFLGYEAKIVAHVVANQVWGSRVAVAAVDAEVGQVVRIIWVDECDLTTFGRINPDALYGYTYYTGQPPCPPPTPPSTRCPTSQGTAMSTQAFIIPSAAPPHVSCVSAAFIDGAIAHYRHQLCPQSFK